MARPKNDGKGRLGGRKKGTPNKNTQSLIDKANELGVDPYEVLLLFAGDKYKELGYKKKQNGESPIPPSLRASCASDACQYIHPKRKSIDLKNEDGSLKPQVVITLPSNGREKD